MRTCRSLAILLLAVGIAACAVADPASGPASQSAPSPDASTPGAPAIASAALGSPAPATTPAATGTGDPTPADVDQLVAQVRDAPIDLANPGPTLDRTEQTLKDSIRQAGGVAELLGPHGAALLAGIDDAERQAVRALVTQLGGTAATGEVYTTADGESGQAGPAIAGRTAGFVVPGPAGVVGTAAQEGGESLIGAFLFTMLAPDLYAKAARDAGSNGLPPEFTEETKTPDGATFHLTLRPSIEGSLLTAEVKVTAESPGPPAYKEESTGLVVVDLCPDANGTVSVALSLTGGYSLLGGGSQYVVEGSIEAHVDDNAKVASMEVQVNGSLASQPVPGRPGAAKAPMFAELKSSYSFDMATMTTGNAVATSPRYSSRVDMDFLKSAFGTTLVLGNISAYLALGSAERQWTTGYCMAITVPSLDPGASRSVSVSSSTPFTASVRHTIEKRDLAVPVTATLTSGGVSVDPSGARVPAPATFTYVAPGKDRETATVTLETRSKRGVATLVVTFRTASPGWILQRLGGVIAGKKCDGPGGAWVEEMEVPSLGMTQRWVMTIDEATLTGTYTMDAVQKLKGGTGIWHGTGTVTLVLGPDGTAEFRLSGGTTTITVKTTGGSGTQRTPGPEGQHSVWVPAGAACT